jgi:hypothetical protein
MNESISFAKPVLSNITFCGDGNIVVLGYGGERKRHTLIPGPSVDTNLQMLNSFK